MFYTNQIGYIYKKYSELFFVIILTKIIGSVHRLKFVFDVADDSVFKSHATFSNLNCIVHKKCTRLMLRHETNMSMSQNEVLAFVYFSANLNVTIRRYRNFSMIDCSKTDCV